MSVDKGPDILDSEAHCAGNKNYVCIYHSYPVGFKSNLVVPCVYLYL